jgi:hypothetical protein
MQKGIFSILNRVFAVEKQISIIMELKLAILASSNILALNLRVMITMKEVFKAQRCSIEKEAKKCLYIKYNLQEAIYKIYSLH